MGHFSGHRPCHRRMYLDDIWGRTAAYSEFGSPRVFWKEFLPQYNRVSMALLDENAFFHDATSLAVGVKYRDEMAQRLEKKRDDRIVELHQVIDEIGSSLAYDQHKLKCPAAIDAAKRLWRTRSLDSIIHFIAGTVIGWPEDAIIQPPPTDDDHHHRRDVSPLSWGTPYPPTPSVVSFGGFDVPPGFDSPPPSSAAGESADQGDYTRSPIPPTEPQHYRGATQAPSDSQDSATGASPLNQSTERQPTLHDRPNLTEYCASQLGKMEKRKRDNTPGDGENETDQASLQQPSCVGEGFSSSYRPRKRKTPARTPSQDLPCPARMPDDPIVPSSEPFDILQSQPYKFLGPQASGSDPVNVACQEAFEYFAAREQEDLVRHRWNHPGVYDLFVPQALRYEENGLEMPGVGPLPSFVPPEPRQDDPNHASSNYEGRFYPS